MTAPLPDLQKPRHVGRGESIRLLLAPARVRESLSVAPSPPLRNAAVAGMQVSMSVLIAVALAHFSPWAHLEGFPALGAEPGSNFTCRALAALPTRLAAGHFVMP